VISHVSMTWLLARGLGPGLGQMNILSSLGHSLGVGLVKKCSSSRVKLLLSYASAKPPDSGNCEKNQVTFVNNSCCNS
jgi:hypothetical protein